MPPLTEEGSAPAVAWTSQVDTSKPIVDSTRASTAGGAFWNIIPIEVFPDPPPPIKLTRLYLNGSVARLVKSLITSRRSNFLTPFVGTAAIAAEAVAFEDDDKADDETATAFGFVGLLELELELVLPACLFASSCLAAFLLASIAELHIIKKT